MGGILRFLVAALGSLSLSLQSSLIFQLEPYDLGQLSATPGPWSGWLQPGFGSSSQNEYTYDLGSSLPGLLLSYSPTVFCRRDERDDPVYFFLTWLRDLSELGERCFRSAAILRDGRDAVTDRSRGVTQLSHTAEKQ